MFRGRPLSRRVRFGILLFSTAWVLASQSSLFAQPADPLRTTGPARSTPAVAVTTSAAWDLLKTGEYAKCVESAEFAVAKPNTTEEWWLIALQTNLALGKNDHARILLEQALPKFSRSCRIRQLGHDIYRINGDLPAAKRMLDEIEYLVGRSAFMFTDAENLVCLGRAALVLGADPKIILERFYDRARKQDPKCREVYLATGELALGKNDDRVAANAFTAGLEKFPDDPDLHFGLAKAFRSSDSDKSRQSLAITLQQNPRHEGALLFSVDFLIDSERYEQAETVLSDVLAVNPKSPEAWTYRAVLAHLRGDVPHESACRAAALQDWPSNPAVDHLFGKKLSQKYRFAEGAALQRQALVFDPKFQPAKVQLSQDLLRLGHEEEGWRLANEAHQNDEYDVVTFNLMQLRDSIADFKTLVSEHFLLKMDAHEADVYGDQALALLEEAQKALGEKYGFQPVQPVTVEIFPQQSDFAVRTFGMPGGSGYLGVCFGNVITANSPASQRANPSNWKSVLWHEYCHVVTLQLTHNKMPRWLSEGISVYEERQANPAWGQRMGLSSRQMILENKMTPVGQLSAAFLNPPSGQHLQFAYYQSSMVVEYFIERFGFENLKRVLQDLGAGMPINAALERHSGLTIGLLEKQFEEYAQQAALERAPRIDMRKEGVPEREQATEEAFSAWLADHPDSYAGLSGLASLRISQQRWHDAIEPLEKMAELFPDLPGKQSPLAQLAMVYRKLGDTDNELAVLRKWAIVDDSAVEAYTRLLDVDTAAKDWAKVRENADRLYAVDPLRRDVQWLYGRANEELGDDASAINAYTSLLCLEPTDPAEVHFRLARLLQQSDREKAKRHVLLSLEAAPRFRDAQKLLLEFVNEKPGEASAPSRPK